MKLLLSKTLWGVDEMQDESNWDGIFQKIKAEGFSAVESICLGYMTNPTLFKELLKKHNLELIIQIHTSGGYLNENGYVYCSSCKLDDHLRSFQKQLIDALEMGAILINVHSGHDSWNHDTALSYFKQVLEIEKNEVLLNEKYAHVIVVHETHRQRLLYSPFQAKELLLLPELKNLKINADLSHWVCVCERVFDMSDPRDDWWEPLLNIVGEHCYFIHARFGHAEGPQIYDPREQSSISSTSSSSSAFNEEFKNEIEKHLDWWERIWKIQKSNGFTQSYLEPEHGPEPYQTYFAMPKKRKLNNVIHFENTNQVQEGNSIDLTTTAAAAAATAADNVVADSVTPEILALSSQEKEEILWDINRYVAHIVTDRFNVWSATNAEKIE